MTFFRDSNYIFIYRDHYSEFLALPYDEFDIMLKDINELKLENIGEAYEIEHLSADTFTSPSFPVNGIIHGPNLRFMVPLVCQRAGKPNSKVINIWFLIGTGSPFTCLTVKSLELFFGAGNVKERNFYSFAIQDQDSSIECQVSKVGTHFEHVNILGVDAMRSLRLSAIGDINWNTGSFCLSRQ
ncbi:hypothetical protein FO519_002083 [Halicephalobus sp. NKZ332]|nr:hypothetical protein FO519_002083 [Halicephalobus sp. NKZ332]